ncbi:hypothetical protein TraAM80_00338 [Trypanosoma rangeli]|uniref:Mitochondrial RNA binding protein n=1 Tax=Trypanosoma rangeli TaxID=5698 RepID=A0A3R7MWR0_TRYRA|nr:uncharacterized protein TraAM80_00338 [Trypanosoma rangeli]RNF12485.1 hypothetical protein TraAM80_00338 [Trypanosoma rangeli]|eukprot:RNF12485.1 hypothetical protein TraAM80_00338 [Trypanosoma rangeli]
MFSRCLLGRSWNASQTAADRLLASQHHHRLIDSRYWDCTTPSKALSVLGVLLRSGTIIDKLDNAASGALNAMGPSMTRSEQVLLGKWSSLMRLKASVRCSSSPSTSAAELGISNRDVHKSVVTLYSFFVGDSQTRISAEESPIIFSSDLVLQLDPIGTLMFLEMLLSTSFQQDAAWRNENITVALLTRLRSHVMYSKVIGLRAIQWILDVLGDKESLLCRRPVEGGRLFRACLRRLHDMLPELTAGDCLLIFPLLQNTLYDKPFVICAEIMKRLVVCEVEELTAVPTSVILHTLECEELVPRLRRRLYQLLCEDYRIGSLGKGECLFLLSIIATSSPCMDEAEQPKYDNDNDFLLCESLFAQLYVTAKSMNAMECVTALEYMEVLTLSQVSVPASSDLLERLKKRLFYETRHALRQSNLSARELKCELEAIHRIEGVLRRCVLLPFLADDAVLIEDLVTKINCRLEKPLDGTLF